MKISIALVFTLLMTAMAGTAAQTEQKPSLDGLESGGRDSFIYPRNALSSADPVFVLYGDNCGRPHIDPTRAATVTEIAHQPALEASARVVDIYLVWNPEEICLAVVMPDVLVPIALGSLGKGLHRIERRLHVREKRETTHRLVESHLGVLGVGDVPHQSLSGAWFDPSAPGTGVFISLVDVAEGSPGAIVHITGLDVAGKPVWQVGMGQFENARLRVDLQTGGTSDSAGRRTLELTYQGCGRAQMRFMDAPIAVKQLTQLTSTYGVESCMPPALQRP
jgi:hypothetical protein